MDASHLTQTFALAAVALAIGRFVLTSAGRAGDGMAGLFVPPDRSLGWPAGVQEIDEPWAWRRPTSGIRDVVLSQDADDGRTPSVDALSIEPRHGRYVVPLARVAPVRLAVRSN